MKRKGSHSSQFPDQNECNRNAFPSAFYEKDESLSESSDYRARGSFV